MVNEEDIVGPIYAGLGQWKNVEVCDAIAIVDQHLGVLINGVGFWQHEECFHAEIFQP